MRVFFPVLVAFLMSCSEAEPEETGQPKDLLTQTLETLASDKMAGRGSNSKGARATRSYLIGKLEELGAQPVPGGESFEHPFGDGVNLIGLFAPEGQTDLQPRLLLTAHYDHLGKRCRKHPKARSSRCNGATDNAAGVAAVLAALEKAIPQLKSPVAVCFWDQEEKQMMGSGSFVANPTMPLDRVQLILNLDVVGMNMLKGFENNHFAIGAETGGAALMGDLQTHAEAVSLDLRPLSYAFGHRRNDLTSFFRAQTTIPMVLLTDGQGAVYHTTADEIENVNMEKVGKVAELVTGLLIAVSEGLTYEHQKTRLFRGDPLPVFADLIPLREVVACGIDNAAANELSPELLAKFEKELKLLDFINREGESHFGVRQAETLLDITFRISTYLNELPIIP